MIRLNVPSGHKKLELIKVTIKKIKNKLHLANNIHL